ncbi:TPA: Phosphoribosylformylglycinamidine cyclo-ligase, chloroplastic, variant 2 [Trebouxia sp. C0005]
MQTHDTIGIDLVAMSVNDIITSGAKPMFFLDYFATAKLDVDVAESVVKGIVEGCRQSDCALLGGETAEMPGLYQPGEYDVAGFAVGSVKQNRVIDGKQIKEGDVLVALPSSGLHSNGFSLVRKVVEVSGKSLQDPAPWGGAGTLGHALLEPTLIYVKRLLALTDAVHVKGCVHITGGGFTENLPRVMPKGLACKVQTSSWEWPPLFQWLQQAGNIATPEMYRTFNMGVGMVVILPESDVEKALAIDGAGFVLGTVVTGDEVQIV